MTGHGSNVKLNKKITKQMRNYAAPTPVTREKLKRNPDPLSVLEEPTPLQRRENDVKSGRPNLSTGETNPFQHGETGIQSEKRNLRIGEPGPFQ